MIDYPKGIRSRIVKNINGLSMHILEAGYENNVNKPCILLLHGFPELAYSWRKILKPLSDAGYYVIAPDQRIYKSIYKNFKKPVTYSLIKHAMVGLTKYYASDLAKFGITCNAISPAGVFNDQKKKFINNLISLIPMNRMANKNEYISTVQYLCTDASSYLTGQNIVLDGGRSIW